MKQYKTLAILLLSVVVLTSFTRCSSLKKTNTIDSNKDILKLDNKASFALSQTYYQNWVAGVKGGGSGIHMYITVESNKNNVVFDSAYFRGYQAKLELSKMGYIASFKTAANNKKDIIMSNKLNAEYGNQVYEKQDFPFDIKEDQCVISYIENNTKKYLLVENLIEKRRVLYPSAPQKH